MSRYRSLSNPDLGNSKPFPLPYLPSLAKPLSFPLFGKEGLGEIL